MSDIRFKNVITGFLGAILVTLALQVITPPNLTLTSKADPHSLTGRLVWNTKFELAAIALGFLAGFLLGNLGTGGRSSEQAERKSFRLSR